VYLAHPRPQAGVADLPTWFEAGKTEYFSDAVTLGLVQALLMNWVEVRRWKDMQNPGSVNGDPIFKQFKVTGTEVGYPGGRWFDPFNFAAEPKAFAQNKVKEIKNGAWLAARHAAAQQLTRRAINRASRHGCHGWLLHAVVCHRRGPRGQPVRAHQRPRPHQLLLPVRSTRSSRNEATRRVKQCDAN
jgi:hypothetical protein